MSRKKTIKTVKLKPQALAKSVFKAKTLKVADESDTALINAAVKKATVEKAERALLDDELAKPSAARNPALMRKYGTENIAGAVDAYPDLDKGGKFHIIATVPDDPDIPLEHRPTVWSITIVITHNGNKFDFVFPFARAIGIPTAAFKLDRYQVYLDVNHNVIVDLSPDYTIYEALLDYKNNDETYLEDRKAMFEKLDVLKDGKLDFRIRGLGMLVKSTRLKGTTTTVTKTVKEPVKKETAEPKVVKVIVLDDVTYENNEAVAKKLADVVRNTGSFRLLGLSSKDKIKDEIHIGSVYASSRLSAPTIVLDDIVDGEIIAVAIAGPTSAESLTGKKLSTTGLETWVITKNREVFAKFMSMNA